MSDQVGNQNVGFLMTQLNCALVPLTSFKTEYIILNRGINDDFLFINIRKVSREVLTTEGEAQGFSTLLEGPCEC